MGRANKQLTVTIPAGAAVSAAIPLEGYGAAIVVIPAAWTTAALGVKVGGSSGAAGAPLKDRANGYGEEASIAAPAVGAAYPLPDYIFAAPYLRLWSHNGSGTNVNQAAERTIIVYLKS